MWEPISNQELGILLTRRNWLRSYNSLAAARRRSQRTTENCQLTTVTI
jgi:hypothetical protein